MKYLVVKTYSDLAYIQLAQRDCFLKKLTPVIKMDEIPEGVPEENISSTNENVSKQNFCKNIRDCLQFLKFPIYNADKNELHSRTLELVVEHTDEMNEVNVEEIDLDEEYNRVLGIY